MEKKRPYRVIISGGGTGGHIYPAIAIANKLKEKFSDTEVLFVGAENRMEMQKVPEAGYKIEGLWISGIQRKLTWDNLSFPLKLISSIRKSHRIIKEFKPDVVVGVGGYASGPLLYAATQKGVPALIQEQNSFAGLTNKWLANRIQTACVAYEGMEKFFPKEKVVLTGNPVRSDIIGAAKKREQALEFFDFSEEKPVLLIIGGSLGARTLNEGVFAGLKELIDQGVQVIWQIGRFYYKDIKKRLEEFETTNIRAMEFIKEMDLAYGAADVVVSRAGALSVSELCLAKKPSIFVPSPNVAEDHQTKNARALVEKDAAWMINDREAKENLVDRALELLNNEEERKRLSENIALWGRPEAAEDIVNEILKLIS
ncbi:undecaprenyldiphospho-muramoylpentapeptide beta-N-acetylglucosaminyltransferase [Xanthovirga aplysinae]|uniref:undecaprenyldiphospho-muramoylpentapeptide beta-N-acetylglucosaminyltransferase n=1 Tax=Xanthovirga aplysinae TaxID=2529853 RepID=UPI0016572171|nr:undecaprenyldiphospho-muramoylpentapeptide beta-N-acetylglucosaminyltransferase [Xanthovirga aplysinae]